MIGELLKITLKVPLIPQKFSNLIDFLKYADRTLDVVFSRLMCVLFIITLRQKFKRVTRSRRRTGSGYFTPTTRNSFGLLSQSYCERKRQKSSDEI